MKKIQFSFFLMIFTSLFYSCKNEIPVPGDTDDNNSGDKEFLSTVTTKKAAYFNNLFTRYGNGWTGGDATYSILLPDGRSVWLFGDSFLDTVYADRSRPASGLVRNVFVVQNGSTMTTRISGTLDAPQPFVNTPDAVNQWYWPGDGTVVHDTLFVMMEMIQKTGSGAWDFAYVRTDLVAFSLPSITEISRTTVWSDPNIMYGTDIMENGGYIYIYGSESAAFTKYMHVARVPADNIHAAWQYYNGTTWVSTPPPTSSGRLNKQSGTPVDVSSQFAVFYWKGQYRLLTQEDFFGADIYSWVSKNPTGPWKSRTTVYTTPETGGAIFTYNAWMHPEFVSADSSILMSYNINSNNFFDLFSNADDYRPKFVWIKY